MSNALDVSGIEIEKMEEGDASGIKLLIKRKSLEDEGTIKSDIAKNMELIFGNMANKISNKKIPGGKKIPLTIEDAIFNVKLNVINSLDMMDFDSVDNITSTGDSFGKVTYDKVERSLNKLYNTPEEYY